MFVRTLIYQFWKGEIPAYADLSRRLFAAYAERHGADYHFDDNPTFFTGKYAEYFHALRPVYDDAFLAYDRIIFVDSDVYPKAAASAGILHCPVEHIGMVEELSPAIRQDRPKWITDAKERRWATISEVLFRSRPPRRPDGNPRAFNSGVIVYTREGLRTARASFPDRALYSLVMRLALLPRFYRLDQNYLGMACFRKGIRFTKLDPSWNRIVKATELDDKLKVTAASADTAFVHWQVRNRRDFSERQILDLVESA
jgi:hypothetical protein